jgi:hypothetical protein
MPTIECPFRYDQLAHASCGIVNFVILQPYTAGLRHAAVSHNGTGVWGSYFDVVLRWVRHINLPTMQGISETVRL